MEEVFSRTCSGGGAAANWSLSKGWEKDNSRIQNKSPAQEEGEVAGSLCNANGQRLPTERVIEMKIKEATFHECDSCGHLRRVSDEAYGCDTCRKPIDFGGKQRQYLQLTVFRRGNGPQSSHMQFCSWECTAAKLKTIKTDYFITLPLLHYDQRQKGIRAKDFLALLK